MEYKKIIVYLAEVDNIEIQLLIKITVFVFLDFMMMVLLIAKHVIKVVKVVMVH